MLYTCVAPITNMYRAKKQKNVSWTTASLNIRLVAKSWSEFRTSKNAYEQKIKTFIFTLKNGPKFATDYQIFYLLFYGKFQKKVYIHRN